MTTGTSKIALVTLALLATGIPAQAAELPGAFLGAWTTDGGNTGVFVRPRYYKETGYNCPIQSITAKDDADSSDHGRVYIIGMFCGVDGFKPPPPQKVREVWALRKIDDKELLVMSSTSGPTYPSIRVLQRRNW